MLMFSDPERTMKDYRTAWIKIILMRVSLQWNDSMKIKWHEKQHHQQQKYKRGPDLHLPLVSVALCICFGSFLSLQWALCNFMSVMFLSKKSNNSEGQVQNTVWFSLQKSRVYLTIIILPAQMGFEAIAHEAEGWVGYWLRGHEGERNNKLF